MKYELWTYTRKEYQGWVNSFSWGAGLCLGQSRVMLATMQQISNKEDYTLKQAAENIKSFTQQEIEHWFLVAMEDGYRYRRTDYYEDASLLVSEMKGDAFGHVDYADLAELLLENIFTLRDPENPFTKHLWDFLIVFTDMRHEVNFAMLEAFEDPDETSTEVPALAAVDALKDYFDEASDDWSSKLDKERKREEPMTVLMKGFAGIWFDLVDWEAVAKHFQGE